MIGGVDGGVVEVCEVLGDQEDMVLGKSGRKGCDKSLRCRVLVLGIVKVAGGLEL